MKDGLKSELCGGRLAFWNYTTIEGNISPTASIHASIISVANQFINNNSGKNKSSLPLFGENFWWIPYFDSLQCLWKSSNILCSILTWAGCLPIYHISLFSSVHSEQAAILCRQTLWFHEGKKDCSFYSLSSNHCFIKFLFLRWFRSYDV